MEEYGLKNYAYIGDAVWELIVRNVTISRSNNAKELHKISTDRVNASFQACLLELIQPMLTEEELDIARRGRNLSIPVSRKANQAEYRLATAFETLIGWWYKHDKARLEEMKLILLEKL